MNNAAPGPPRLHIACPDPAWNLIFQSGVEFACTVGVPLADLLREGMALSEAQIAAVDCLLLDGMPVDDPRRAVIRDGARLALAAGLPGIAGLALKSGSAVRALRAGITHPEEEGGSPAPGHISLHLYSLALQRLAPHFLERGVIIQRDTLRRYARLLTLNCPCTLDGMPRDLNALLDEAPQGDGRVLLTVAMGDRGVALGVEGAPPPQAPPQGHAAP